MDAIDRKMNALELQALRRLLFFSTVDAATIVAASPDHPQGVSERAWKHWEAGARAVPDDVAERIRSLADMRETMIDNALAMIDEADRKARAKGASDHDVDASQVRLVFYTSVTDWPQEPIHWRVHQSALAGLLASDDRVRLVAFDGPTFAAWLGKRKDSESMRAAWAVQIE